MKQLFNMDSPLFNILGKMANLMILNLLWLLGCLPILTIGSSTAALYYVTLKLARKEDPYIVRSFFHSFRENLRQGILLTLFFLCAALLLYVDLQISTSIPEMLGLALHISLLFIALLLLITILYVFPLLAQFQNTVPQILKNAFILSLSKLPCTLLISLVHLFPIAFLFFFPSLFLRLLPILLLFGGSVIAQISSILYVRIFASLIEKNG